MSVELVQPPYDEAEFKNPQNPFSVPIHPQEEIIIDKYATKMHVDGAEVPNFALGIGSWAVDQAAKKSDILAVNLDTKDVLAVSSSMLNAAWMGEPHRPWYLQSLKKAKRYSNDTPIFRFDFGLAKILSNMEDKTGIESFYALTSENLLLFDWFAETLKGGDSAILAYNRKTRDLSLPDTVTYEAVKEDELRHMLPTIDPGRWDLKFLRAA